MKKAEIIFFGVLVVLLCGRCTEYIDLELETSSRRLVVDGMITDERKMQYLRLTQSVPFLSDTVSPPVSGANVYITNGYGVEILRESNEMPGFYLTENDFTAPPENYYELTVSGVDIDEDGETETYRAVSYMPEVEKPDSINLVYDETWEIWKVLLYGSDNLETEDYYLFRLMINGTLISDNISEYNVASDRFFEDGRADGVWVQSINANRDAEPLQEGDVVSLQMCGITEAYFDFLEGVQREGRGQYPLFSGPPANAPGNISNDALGFFAAFSVSSVNFVVTADLLAEKNSPD